MKQVCFGNMGMSHSKATSMEVYEDFKTSRRNFKREPNLLAQYNQILQDQLETGIVERVTSEPVGREFYIPHKPVIRESAESTKLRTVFDASAKANEKSPSLNDCLETGPALQNR